MLAPSSSELCLAQPRRWSANSDPMECPLTAVSERAERLGTMAKHFALALLVLGTLAGSAEAAGLLNRPVAVQDTAFCTANRCEAAGRRPNAGSVWEFLYTTAPDQQALGPQLQLYGAQGRVVGAALNFAGPVTPFTAQDYAQAGTPTELTAEFAALLLGQTPTWQLLKKWQASCDTGKRLNFAGARLTCSRWQPGPGAEALSFHIGQ